MVEKYGLSVRRICVGVDAQKYSTGSDHRQADFQEAIERTLDLAAANANLDRTSWTIQRTGDGEFSVLSETERESHVVDAFVRQIAACLRRFNSDRVEDARLRLRIAIHYGRLTPTRTGFAGPTPVETNRLLNSKELKRALAERPRSVMALIVSDLIFQDTIASFNTTHHPRDFRKVRVDEKEFSGDAWIWIPEIEESHSHTETSVAPRLEPQDASGPSTYYNFYGSVNTGRHTTFGPRH